MIETSKNLLKLAVKFELNFNVLFFTFFEGFTVIVSNVIYLGIKIVEIYPSGVLNNIVINNKYWKTS